MDAILPKEQESELGEEENKDKSQAALSAAQAQQKADAAKEKLVEEQQSLKSKDNSLTTVAAEASTSGATGQSPVVAMDTNAPNATPGETPATSDPLIDNPYLRAIIMPKISRNFGKKVTYTSSLKYGL